MTLTFTYRYVYLVLVQPQSNGSTNVLVPRSPFYNGSAVLTGEEGAAIAVGDTVRAAALINGFTYRDTYVGPYQGLAAGEPLINKDGLNILFTNTNYTQLTTLTLSKQDYVFCFLAGTAISTPQGPRAIETLEPGDPVLTHDGGIAPVKWLFRQTVSMVFADAARVAPIRIRANALSNCFDGAKIPERDLLVSGDHALLLDGVLVQAGALVNGETIVRETAMPATFVYYHIELADHGLLLAEGAPAETFIDAASRRAFDNWRAYEAQHGDQATVAGELDLPRVKSARQLSRALQTRLAYSLSLMMTPTSSASSGAS
jgi:hypothetical protein